MIDRTRRRRTAATAIVADRLSDQRRTIAARTMRTSVVVDDAANDANVYGDLGGRWCHDGKDDSADGAMTVDRRRREAGTASAKVEQHSALSSTTAAKRIRSSHDGDDHHRQRRGVGTAHLRNHPRGRRRSGLRHGGSAAAASRCGALSPPSSSSRLPLFAATILVVLLGRCCHAVVAAGSSTTTRRQTTLVASSADGAGQPPILVASPPVSSPSYLFELDEHHPRALQNDKNNDNKNNDKNGTPAPTFVPTASPTEAPTKAPTDAPTKVPTGAPTKAPTHAPTKVPTDAPTKAPTDAPTDAPTKAPTSPPTATPTLAPTTETPTYAPIAEGDPTRSPTTFRPTKNPTSRPTKRPTNKPTRNPTSTFVGTITVNFSVLPISTSESEGDAADDGAGRRLLVAPSLLPSEGEEEEGKAEETSHAISLSAIVSPSSGDANDSISTGANGSRDLTNKVTALTLADGSHPTLLRSILTSVVRALCRDVGDFKFVTDEEVDPTQLSLEDDVCMDDTYVGSWDTDVVANAGGDDGEDNGGSRRERNRWNRRRRLTDAEVEEDEGRTLNDDDGEDAVLLADPNDATISLLDKSTVIPDGSQLEWIEMGIAYDVIRVGRTYELLAMENEVVDSIEENDEVTGKALDEMERAANLALTERLLDGKFDGLLATALTEATEENGGNGGDDASNLAVIAAVASSPIGREVELFTAALESYHAEQQNNDGGDGGGDGGNGDGGADPIPFEERGGYYEPLDPAPLHPIRIAGIIMLVGTIGFVLFLFGLAGRRKREREWDDEYKTRGRGGLVTEEGLDYMLEVGRQETSRRVIEAQGLRSDGGGTAADNGGGEESSNVLPGGVGLNYRTSSKAFEGERAQEFELQHFGANMS